jgi:uncharacterized RDD family membrane protein YckC
MNNITPSFPRAGFRRRFGSWVYDLLLSIAVYMVAGAVSFAIFAGLANLGIVDTGNETHLINVMQNSFFYTFVNELWKFFWVAFFFVWFWTRTGQTLGMRAWRLRVQNSDASLISKKIAIKRLLPTLLGLGNLTVIFDRKNKLSLQDRLTNTEVVVLSLEANKGPNWSNG